MEIALTLATAIIRFAAAWLAFRLYRDSRDWRFGMVTFVLTVTSLFPLLELAGPPQGVVTEWLRSAANGLAVLLTALILVRTLTDLSKAQEQLRAANDALEQRVADRTRALQTANASLEDEVQERKRAEQALLASEGALRRNQVELQRLAGQLIAAQEEERRRLARELHDDLSQTLAALALELANAQRGADEAQPRLRRALEHIEGTVHKLAEDIHDMSRLLHPSILDDLGLEAAIRAECERFGDREGVPVDFRVEGSPHDLSGDAALTLYRITQEALHNVSKHAAAERVAVSLEATEDAVSLTIEDSGCGFDLEAARRQSGLGLISMSERIRLLDGCLEIRTAPGEGTRIEATTPVTRSSTHEQAESLVGG